MLTILLAALAVLGLFTLLWLLFGLFLIPVGTIATVQVQVLADGSAETLEHTLSGLLWLQKSGLLEARIDVVDNGLDEYGLACTERLVKVHPGMSFIRNDR